MACILKRLVYTFKCKIIKLLKPPEMFWAVFIVLQFQR